MNSISSPINNSTPTNAPPARPVETPNTQTPVQASSAPLNADAQVDLSSDAFASIDANPVAELPNDLSTYSPAEEDINQSTAGGFAESLYEGLLGREPDQGGLDFWTAGLENGQFDTASATSNFVNSEEFKQQNLSKEDTVELLYETLLDRGADEGGLAFHVANIESKGIDGVIADLVGSDEFKMREADGEIKSNFAQAPTPAAAPTSPVSSTPESTVPSNVEPFYADPGVDPAIQQAFDHAVATGVGTNPGATPVDPAVQAAFDHAVATGVGTNPGATPVDPAVQAAFDHAVATGVGTNPGASQAAVAPNPFSSLPWSPTPEPAPVPQFGPTLENLETLLNSGRGAGTPSNVL